MAEIVIEDNPLFNEKSLANLLSSIPSYHSDEDTFFISPQVHSPAVSYDIDGELWIRFDPQTKEIVGLEIEHFESIFLKKHPELSNLWREVKPYCVNKKTRLSNNKKDVCDSFILILVEFFSNLMKNSPQQSAFGFA